MFRRSFSLSLVAALGCSDGGDLNRADAGPSDTAVPDASSGFDFGPPPDSGFQRPDGSTDMGTFFPPGVVFRGRRRVSGVDLQVELRGDPDSSRPPVVLLNMGPETGFEYLREPMEFLLGEEPIEAPERLLVYLDLPAQGRSQDLSLTDNSTISIEAQYEGLVAILDDLQAPYLGEGPVDVIGHGYGGLVGSLLAAREPNRMNRLVLVAPYPPEVQTWRDAKAETLARLAPGEANQIAMLTSWGSGTECLRNLDECVIQIFELQAKYWVCPENAEAFSEIDVISANWTGLRSVEQELRRTSYTYVQELSRVEAPTTVIVGPCDPTVPRECQGAMPDPQTCSLPTAWDIYRSQLQNRRFTTLDGTGYFPMVEDPVAFQAEVLEALEGPAPEGQN